MFYDNYMMYALLFHVSKFDNTAHVMYNYSFILI